MSIDYKITIDACYWKVSSEDLVKLNDRRLNMSRTDLLFTVLKTNNLYRNLPLQVIVRKVFDAPTYPQFSVSRLYCVSSIFSTR